MSFAMRSLLCVLLLNVLTACGLKDDLYLPAPEPSATVPAGEPIPADEDEQDDEHSGPGQ